MLAVLLGCGLRRRELTQLELIDIQRREDHWAIVDLIGKGGHVRTVPMPDWVKLQIDQWCALSGVSTGRYFGACAERGKSGARASPNKRCGTSSNPTAPNWDGLRLPPRPPQVVCSPVPRVQAANWNRFSFCWGTFQFRQRNDTLGANNASAKRSTTRSALSRILDRSAQDFGRS